MTDCVGKPIENFPCTNVRTGEAGQLFDYIDDTKPTVGSASHCLVNTMARCLIFIRRGEADAQGR